MEQKKLYRSRDNKMISGVCGGVGEFINVDPTIIRLVWAVTCFWGIGIVAYIIGLVVIPER